MKSVTLPTLALAALLAACQPTSDSQYPEGDEPAGAPADAAPASAYGPAGEALNNEVGDDDPIHDAVLTSASATLSEQVGVAVVIEPEIFRSEGDWAFVYGPVRMPDGSTVDWASTLLAEPASEGMMDGDLGVVLLNFADGDWRVVETAIGPTDVPQVSWPAEHHVSPALVGLEG